MTSLPPLTYTLTLSAAQHKLLLELLNDESDRLDARLGNAKGETRRDQLQREYDAVGGLIACAVDATSSTL
jgi:hypothetical protein